MPRKFNLKELDANIVGLVEALNSYPGVATIGSCGGHEVITNPSQWEVGSWYVKFDIEHNDTGWLVVEFLGWAINDDYRSTTTNVSFMPIAAPPYLNEPGECLHFVIEGYNGEDPDKLASFLKRVRRELILQPFPKPMQHGNSRSNCLPGRIHPPGIQYRLITFSVSS
jgi:hypothetical protein